MAYGLCLMAYGLWPLDDGPWLVAFGLCRPPSRPVGLAMAYGQWYMAYGLAFMAYGLWPMARGPGFTCTLSFSLK